MTAIFDIKINEEYSNLVPPLSISEYDLLKEDIKQNGVQLPVVTNQHGDILDGHHRYKIWVVDLGRPVKEMPKPTVLTFNNKLREKIFVINVNLKRRHLNDFQRVELGLKVKPILEEIAQRNQKAGVRILADTSAKNLTEVGRVTNEIGKRAGVSHETVRKVENILQKAPEEIIQKTRHGQMSISYAHQMVKRSNDHNEVKDLPQGQFDIILADPPWNYDIHTRGSPNEHYQVMSQQDIELLQLPSADNAILFLWATFPKLNEALAVMKSWEFKYKTGMVWVKDKIGTGYYFRGQSELLLLAEKGDMPVPEEQNRHSSVLVAPRAEHSEKPELVYDIIEKMYPNRRYLELFARKQPHSDKWTVWGNETGDPHQCK